jgi:hypothetical protein
MVRWGLWTTVFVITIVVSPCTQAREPQALEPLLSPKTRLMVLSPHPDDETLGAGGLIQRVISKGGKVKVAFMTNGEGFPEGVEKENHIAHPTAKDYREYGISSPAFTLSGKQVCTMYFRVPTKGHLSGWELKLFYL